MLGLGRKVVFAPYFVATSYLEGDQYLDQFCFVSFVYVGIYPIII